MQIINSQGKMFMKIIITTKQHFQELYLPTLNQFPIYMVYALNPFGYKYARFAAATVFQSSIAIATGPTPPGTGVINDALRIASS